MYFDSVLSIEQIHMLTIFQTNYYPPFDVDFLARGLYRRVSIALLMKQCVLHAGLLCFLSDYNLILTNRKAMTYIQWGQQGPLVARQKIPINLYV